MGSSRLPGKMVADLAGATLLERVIERTAAVPGIEGIVLATTREPGDQQLVAIAKRRGLAVVRGSVDDVLARFLTAIDESGADHLLRVCGDSVLFDPAAAGRRLAALVAADGDLLAYPGPRDVADHGVEAVSARALRWSDRQGGEDRRAREHVTAYAVAHASQLRTLPFAPDPAHCGRFKFSVDTADDLRLIQAIYQRLQQPGELIRLTDAMALVRGERELALLNSRLHAEHYGPPPEAGS